MGYRSDVYLKTTTEGWLIIKRFNDSIKDEGEQPLRSANISRTSEGFYKIEFNDVKWYEGSFKDVDNFIMALDMLRNEDIPFTFIRIGEDLDDTVKDYNWTDDMPDELADFDV